MPSPKIRSGRTSGLLLHPSSLPGPFGIGDLGPAAYSWVDALARAQQSWWQILPLGPTGHGDSPYQCFSAFAGNPALISPELLVRDGLLTEADVATAAFPPGRVDYGSTIPFKMGLLAHAWTRFCAGGATSLYPAFDEFRHQQGYWLTDYSLFMALKDAHGGSCWLEWPEPLRMRESAATAAASEKLAEKMSRHQFLQFLFFRQWISLRDYAHARGIKIIGDAPIFVAGDSADVWGNPQLFLLDAKRGQTVQAGVPPDYFSETGQLWGNPIYDWNAARQSGYGWWSARLAMSLTQVDLVRLDHFRGFAGAWHVPAGESTAIRGSWVPGPGADLFHKVQKDLGRLPLIAEDLGLITPDVDRLRETFGLPGMRVLQFAFSDPHNKYLPHNFETNTAVYTGTHDNDTTRGWFAGLKDDERDFVRRYLGRDGRDIAWDLIRTAWSSVADLAIAPVQDVLDLGGDARMNTPGKPDGNWQWRLADHALSDALVDRLAELTVLYSRN